MRNETVSRVSDRFPSNVVMPDHFFDDECQELLGKIRVKVGGLCEPALSSRTGSAAGS